MLASCKQVVIVQFSYVFYCKPSIFIFFKVKWTIETCGNIITLHLVYVLGNQHNPIYVATWCMFLVTSMIMYA